MGTVKYLGVYGSDMVGWTAMGIKGKMLAEMGMKAAGMVRNGDIILSPMTAL